MQHAPKHASKHAPQHAPKHAPQHAPLIIDTATATLSKADKKRLAHPLVGGVILFARHWQNRAQLIEQCAAIKAVRPDLLITVDHEGGRVQRFKTDGFTHLPPMAALGRHWLSSPSPSPSKREGDSALEAMNIASAAGLVLGSELRACGVDFSFTPVLDLDWGESGVIGNRAFAQDTRIVTALAQALMAGLRQAGVRNCGKHFPGHGFVKADSHTEIPVDKRSRKAIELDDAAPYGWLSNSLDSVMPAHVIYPKVDSKPAGFSNIWLQDILRAQYHFQGCIFSDDLSMEGARQIDGKTVSYTQAAVAALNAGCDMVLLCNQSQVDGGKALDELINGLEKAQNRGDWQASAASEERRIHLLPDTAPQPWDELMKDPRYLHALDLLASLRG
jgi:beta-N-acetylhexosaminidase